MSQSYLDIPFDQHSIFVSSLSKNIVIPIGVPLASENFHTESFEKFFGILTLINEYSIFQLLNMQIEKII